MADTHKGWLKANMDQAWAKREHTGLEQVRPAPRDMDAHPVGHQCPQRGTSVGHADLRTMDDDDPRTH